MVQLHPFTCIACGMVLIGCAAAAASVTLAAPFYFAALATAR
jgi:hypothetical protein